MGKCYNCKNHVSYWDELDDGTYIDDGCICEHEIADEIYHLDNCDEYAGNLEDCIYYKGE